VSIKSKDCVEMTVEWVTHENADVLVLNVIGKTDLCRQGLDEQCIMEVNCPFWAPENSVNTSTKTSR
jgi:hypothetical protein